MIHTRSQHHEELSLLPLVAAYGPYLACAVAALFIKVKEKNHNEETKKGQDQNGN